jgi:hypothetical protein
MDHEANLARPYLRSHEANTAFVIRLARPYLRSHEANTACVISLARPYLRSHAAEPARTCVRTRRTLLSFGLYARTCVRTRRLLRLSLALHARTCVRTRRNCVCQIRPDLRLYVAKHCVVVTSRCCHAAWTPAAGRLSGSGTPCAHNVEVTYVQPLLLPRAAGCSSIAGASHRRWPWRTSMSRGATPSGKGPAFGSALSALLQSLRHIMQQCT